MHEPQKTQLYDEHVKLGARIVDFHGWLLPVQYEGIIAEHEATRTGATIFDTCHMGRITLSGDGSTKHLSDTLTMDVQGLGTGKCRYGFMLNDNGGIIDDLIIYRRDKESWLVIVNASRRENDLARIQQDCPDTVKITDLSSSWGKIDVQGPGSINSVTGILGNDLRSLRYFSFTEAEHNGRPVIVSRTGYTGEPGFELYAENDLIIELWQYFTRHDVVPAGLGARDTLRLEAGYPLYGNELSEDVTPVEAGMMQFVRKSFDFKGAEVVRARMDSDPEKLLVGFRVDGRRPARSHAAISMDGGKVGEVTSGSFAPTLAVSCGMAYILPGCAQPGTRIEIDTWRASTLNATVSKTPFYVNKKIREIT